MSDTDDRPLRQLSKRLSWALRHAAAELGLLIDPEGFVAIDDLIKALGSDRPMTRAQIAEVVTAVAPEKQRFEIRDGWIRANYGHSLATRIEHPNRPPPPLLFHGTSLAALPAIKLDGLRPMNRQYVHLCTDPDLATQVGARHGPPVLLRVNAAAAHRAHVPFYCANPHFWLADHVPRSSLNIADHPMP